MSQNVHLHDKQSTITSPISFVLFYKLILIHPRYQSNPRLFKMDLLCCVHIADCEDFTVELLCLPPESAASVIHLDNPDFCASFYHN